MPFTKRIIIAWCIASIMMMLTVSVHAALSEDEARTALEQYIVSHTTIHSETETLTPYNTRSNPDGWTFSYRIRTADEITVAVIRASVSTTGEVYDFEQWDTTISERLVEALTQAIQHGDPSSKRTFAMHQSFSKWLMDLSQDEKQKSNKPSFPADDFLTYPLLLPPENAVDEAAARQTATQALNGLPMWSDDKTDALFLEAVYCHQPSGASNPVYEFVFSLKSKQASFLNDNEAFERLLAREKDLFGAFRIARIHVAVDTLTGEAIKQPNVLTAPDAPGWWIADIKGEF